MECDTGYSMKCNYRPFSGSTEETSCLQMSITHKYNIRRKEILNNDTKENIGHDPISTQPTYPVCLPAYLYISVSSQQLQHCSNNYATTLQHNNKNTATQNKKNDYTESKQTHERAQHKITSSKTTTTQLKRLLDVQFLNYALHYAHALLRFFEIRVKFGMFDNIDKLRQRLKNEAGHVAATQRQPQNNNNNSNDNDAMLSAKPFAFPTTPGII
ncbi:hypothetical protein HELRODRAFT_160299 [Helobdella robusta]|uniref:Uncharacterized protein n=1 Tax=Helobdella robusta TaxID=6412 RepID=T1EQ24_HELRO|nr:hypothetical protein HELRODRAFT_160299 [Helobdella robusta]ESO06150.1 hypothetical protein HELRODRAFT_160299 [Helobdella robusta]